MPYKILISACLLLSASFNCLTAQNQHPCSYEAVMLKNNPNRLQTEQHFKCSQYLCYSGSIARFP